MTPKTLRGLGLACLLAAALVAILNLKRVAGLNLFPLPVVLMILGIALLTRARKKLQHKS